MTRLATQLRSVVERRPRTTATILALVAAVVLLARLGTPDRIYFDETYYVDDALGYLDTGVEPSFAVHPTLGKWLIALGITVFGDDPTGWRVTGALAGVVVVVLTHLLVRRLLAGTRWGSLLAVLAPLLLLTDGLFIAQSRIAMLDVFLVLFTVLAIHLLVVDRDRRLAGLVADARPSMRWLAGVALGLACAVKWSGLLAVGAAGVLTIAWEVGAASRLVAHGGGRTGVAAVARALPRRALAVTGSLILLPVVVYGLTWLPWLAAYEHTWAADCDDVEPISDCPDASASAAERVDGLIRYHEAGLDFHLGLDSDHSYRSDPLGWVVLARPVVYYWETCSEDRAAGVLVEDDDTGEMVPPEPCEVPVGTAGEILAVGSPALWWGFLGLLPLLVGGALRRDGRSAVPLVTWLSLWLPWLFVSRLAFLFYMAPAVPFLAVGTAVAIDRLDVRHRIAGSYLGALAGGVCGLAIGWALQLLGLVADGWRDRLFATAVGAAVGMVVGALLDLRREGVTRRWSAATGDRLQDDPAAASAHTDTPPIDGSPLPLVHDGPTPADAVSPTLTGPSPTDTEVTDGQGVGLLADSTTPSAVVSTESVPDDRSDTPGPGPALAPAWRVPALASVVLCVAIGLLIFFAPVWYGVPLARDVLRWRWWFDSWI